jgi:hypothetical protein
MEPKYHPEVDESPLLQEDGINPKDRHEGQHRVPCVLY